MLLPSPCRPPWPRRGERGKARGPLVPQFSSLFERVRSSFSQNHHELTAGFSPETDRCKIRAGPADDADPSAGSAAPSTAGSVPAPGLPGCSPILPAIVQPLWPPTEKADTLFLVSGTMPATIKPQSFQWGSPSTATRSGKFSGEGPGPTAHGPKNPRWSRRGALPASARALRADCPGLSVRPDWPRPSCPWS